MQDLLGRNPVRVNLKKSLAYLRGKRVLVTGAGGSIGSELCRQLLSGGVERLYLFGHGENSIYEIDRELRLLQDEGVGEKTAIVPILGDLKDRDFLFFITNKLKADVIFHAAAYKHVPMTEENPVASIENNVFGTENLVDAAINADVRRFVLITTDKAVDPVSVYGAGKQICERIVLRAGENASQSTEFMAVRFGNVLGSRGSIVPLFQRQIEKGGPVTVTHEEMRRYFMTIPEACSLVLKAGGVGQAGKLYLLDMGESVPIRGIAEEMIRFYGFEPDVDIKIKFVGLRPGERIDEKLYSDEELPLATASERLLWLKRKSESPYDLAALLNALRPVCKPEGDKKELYRNAAYLRDTLKAAIPTLLVDGKDSE
jgi:FlaA1/EpsC-like NDP-sugar epimerase